MILLALEVYALIGALVAAVFLTVGIGRVAPDAQGAYAFRPLVAPGVIVLWPLVLVRWFQLERGATVTQSAHQPPKRIQDRAIIVMAVAVPVIIFSALFIMQSGLRDAPAILISAPDETARETSP
ncbi:MAG: hypothetical protein AAGJ94_01245 [Pseudomonadota bacterium]